MDLPAQDNGASKHKSSIHTAATNIYSTFKKTEN